METGDATGLIRAIQAFRKVYEHENQHLPSHQLEAGWQRHWESISAHATHGTGPKKVIPSKRSASNLFGEGPPSKRAGPEHLVSATRTHPLQRQYSAPTGRVGRSSSFNNDNIPRHFPLTSLAADSTSYLFNRVGLGDIDEVQDLSTIEYLERTQDAMSTPSDSPTLLPAVERGEFNDQHSSDLTYHEAYDTTTSQPPMLAIGDSSLVMGSAALSEPMTRSNTDDVLCNSLNMFRMNSLSKQESGLGKTEDPDQTLSFSYSPNMVPTEYHDISFSGSPVPFSYSSEMKTSLSCESDGSSSFSSVHSSPRMQESISSGRLLAPKLESDASLSPADHPRLKLVEVKEADGTVKQKAEIARAARQEPERDTKKCPFCDDNPKGFHGSHELERHIDRHHSSRRKVWICKEKSPGGNFLANCKACRTKKTYGANYNAAAHLRRAHFNPPKNKRGGRGKKSEGRGGMGGGNKPAMDELKYWMYEEWEENLNTDKMFVPDVAVAEAMDAFQQTYYDVGVPDYSVAYPQGPMMMSHPLQQQPIIYTTVAGHQPMPPAYQPHQWAGQVY